MNIQALKWEVNKIETKLLRNYILCLVMDNPYDGENNGESYISSNPSCFRQLKNHVHVRVMDLNTSDDQLLGLLTSLIVDVQGINLSCQMTANLI